MKFIAIIPARYASTRFPGKPLADIQGKPMIQHVYERTSQVFAHCCVATDDTRRGRGQVRRLRRHDVTRPPERNRPLRRSPR